MSKARTPTLRLIAGSGRSGTTWLLDTLAAANGLRPVFEPLHPLTSVVGAQYKNVHLLAGDECPELQKLFCSAATGELRTLWTHYRTLQIRLAPRMSHFSSVQNFKGWLNYWRDAGTRWRERFPQRAISSTLVKCVRANLMLDWINSHFDARIVLLIRHPAAVVESQLRSSIRIWDPYPILEAYRKLPSLMTGPLQHHARLFEEKLSPAQALTLVWAVQNLVPSSQAKVNGYRVVFYEELLENPTLEWGKILETLAVNHIPDSQTLEAPSEQASARWTKQGKPEEGYSRSYGRWHERLGKDLCSEIQYVLDVLEVSFYNTNDARPDPGAFKAQFGLTETA